MNKDEPNTLQDDPNTPRLSLREEQKRVTYERLLNAAKELFETSDANDVTIDQIAKRAGTNRTTFYLHFEDKAQIAFKIRVRYMRGDIEHITRYLTRRGGVTRDDIRKWIRNRTATIRKLKTVIQLGTEILNKKPELMQEFLIQTDEILKAGFAAYLDRFDPDERDRLGAELLLGAVLLNRYLYITVVQELEFPSRQTFDVLVDYWYRILTREP